METEKSRIERFIQATGISIREFERRANLSNGYMKALKESPTCAKMRSILRAFPELNREWVETGEGEMLVAPVVPADVEARPHFPTEVAAGALVGMSDPVTLQDCEMRPVVRQFPSYDYTMVIRGDSMEPKFEGGDEIAIRRVTDFMEWGKVYVLNTQDGAVIKRIYDAGDAYRCVSYNQAYPDFLVPKDSVISIFKVVGQLRY